MSQNLRSMVKQSKPKMKISDIEHKVSTKSTSIASTNMEERNSEIHQASLIKFN